MARAILITAALGCLLPALAGAETLTLMHFLPPADTVTSIAFSCEGKAGEQVDGSVRYGRQRKAEGGHAGGFQEVTIKGQAIDAALLGQLNEKIGDRNIDGISPGCQDDGAIQLLVGLWDGMQPEGRQKTMLIVVRQPDGTVSISD